MRRTRFAFARELAHPLPLFAVAVLALNDHVLKAAAPGVVTGKLSDVAGLFFFPVLLVALGRLSFGERRWLAAAACGATAIVFSAVKLVPALNDLVARTWGAMSMDATDLFALPMTALAYAWMKRPRRSLAEAWQPVAVVAASVASMATSAVHVPGPPPQPPTAREIAFRDRCANFGSPAMTIADGQATVRVPLTLLRADRCAVAIRGARLKYTSGAGVATIDVELAAADAQMDVARDQPGAIDLAFTIAGAPPECARPITLRFEVTEQTGKGPYDVTLGVPCARP